MDTKPAAGPLVYEDFVPSHELIREEGIDTLVVKLPDFKKEQIRVQLDSFGKVRISGERPLADNRRSRFHKEIQASVDCNEVRTRFENGLLYVGILPRLKEDEKKGKEKILVNIIAAVLILVVMALYMTSRN